MFFIYKVAQAALAFNNQPYLLQSGCLLQRVVANSKELVTDSNKWLGATCGVNICNQVVASITSHIFLLLVKYNDVQTWEIIDNRYRGLTKGDS